MNSVCNGAPQLTLPFEAVDRGALPLVGGKAANLGELTRAGLVIEMGGAMSHGAVVAREYGIPAVVGVPDATERIVTGERITVDGSSGMVATEPQSDS